MTPEHIVSNLKSWTETVNSLGQWEHPQMAEWDGLAGRFLQYGIDRKFNRHFRAGRSMYSLLFSTLDHSGLNYEPRVSVLLKPQETINLKYIPELPAPKGDEELEYELGFDEAMPTFHRFLNHLWTMTRTEPIPSDMRSPDNKFTAPILSEKERKTSSWFDRFF